MHSLTDRFFRNFASPSHQKSPTFCRHQILGKCRGSWQKLVEIPSTIYYSLRKSWRESRTYWVIVLIPIARYISRVFYLMFCVVKLSLKNWAWTAFRGSTSVDSWVPAAALWMHSFLSTSILMMKSQSKVEIRVRDLFVWFLVAYGHLACSKKYRCDNVDLHVYRIRA